MLDTVLTPTTTKHSENSIVFVSTLQSYAKILSFDNEKNLYSLKQRGNHLANENTDS